VTVVDDASHGSSHILLLPSSAQAVATARSEVAEFLRTRGVDAAVIDDSVVIISELVTNAVRHAAPGVRAKLRMECTVGPDGLCLEVSDGGSSAGPPLHERGAVGGRGLFIVAALADSWSFHRTDAGTVVTAQLVVDRALPHPA